MHWKRALIILFCWSAYFTEVVGQEVLPHDNFDITTLRNIARTRTDGRSQVFQTISDANNYVNIGVPIGLFAVGAINNDKTMRQNALYIGTSTAITAVVNYGLKQLFKRKRPFRKYNNFVAVTQASGYSFPSGHTSSAFSNAVSLSQAYPKWYVIAPSLLWSSSVAYSRMYLGVHYPSDIAAGALLGSGVATGIHLIRR
ncbi:phosphatase PAP2 family protein [Sphingobacterium yanglingense]|uniref:Undecaprenyl-diphosphatase n=1 Tax=Sphingobacterium yanglingense TaxID=1437280 RepID=A0A4R6WET7_9SPHI|nr:phosphatase PAP2 family protein [Sphingobacterium yanglingense]TDQ78263.1 undecaprenyl-diphosphatase [Sphingobacterium yanglingense]